MEQIAPNGTVITVVHFTKDEGAGERIACMPNMTEFHQTIYHPAYIRTNDPRAANCPACKKSQVFTQALEDLTNTLKRPTRG